MFLSTLEFFFQIIEPEGGLGNPRTCKTPPRDPVLLPDLLNLHENDKK